MPDDTKYVISERANIALDALAAELRLKLGKVVRSPHGALYLLTASEAQRIYFEAVRRVLSDGGFAESHDGRFIVVKCPGCGRSETIAAKVTRYRCRCDPHTDRFTCQDVVAVPDQLATAAIKEP